MPSQEVANQPIVNPPIYTEPKTTHIPEPTVAANESVAELAPSSDADASFLKAPARSPIDETSLPPMSSDERKNLLFEEVDEPSSPDMSVAPSQREPLFVALAAAAKASPESEDERDMARRKAINATDENGKPFEYRAESPSRASSKPKFDDISFTSVSPAAEDVTTLMSDTKSDRETPVLRNIAIATAIVFFAIIIAFIVMKYDSISFTPPPPPTPVDRAKIEAEKAAAARAEAERILAEKSIPKRAAEAEGSTIKTEGMLLKNITKAAKDLPKELTTIDLSKGGYTIIVASQPKRENAVAIVEEFGKLGLAATVMEKKVGNAIRYRVRVGQFATSAAANAAKKKYKNIIPADAFLDKVSVASQ
ncbi:MAG: SPOR domain-containing protein, partial [Chloroherpetonaceae bacterium]